ncbi:hypothetical protein [Nostoc sp.]|uniref:hypothetical protein n=1 Tax=Nostoc sp. TaxID=1180 RepID=UPI002FF46749
MIYRRQDKRLNIVETAIHRVSYLNRAVLQENHPSQINETLVVYKLQITNTNYEFCTGVVVCQNKNTRYIKVSDRSQS